MKKFDLSIVASNYDSVASTLRFIDCINISKNFSILDPEIIIVDFTSELDPSEMAQVHPQVKLVKPQEKRGFTDGNRMGIEESSGDYLFMVSNLAVVNLLDLEELLIQYDTCAEYGILSPVFKNEDRSVHHMAFAAVHSSNRNVLINAERSCEKIIETIYPYDETMLISKSYLKEADLMNGSNFRHELDWVDQIRKSGWKVGVCLSSEVIKQETESMVKVSNY
ncbi:MAG: hypothetical protein AAGA66_19045 [Bacteroidota bacterium]